MGSFANDLISETLVDEAAFERVLEESYRHNNGFHKLVMRTFPDGTKIRMHLYEPAKVPKEHVHDHRWAFTSAVLAGHLRMDRFEYADSSNVVYDAFRYSADKTGGRFGLEPIGKRAIRFVEECVFRAGDVYRMQPEELHRIQARSRSSSPTITLMTTHPPVSSTCHLYADPSQLHQLPTPDTQNIEPYSPTDLKDILMRVQAILG